MQVFFGIAYFVVGLVQLFAIAAGIENGLGWHSFFSFAGALFVTYIPLLGSILGVYGATTAWGWDLIQALVLFFWYVPVFLVFLVVGAITGRN